MPRSRHRRRQGALSALINRRRHATDGDISRQHTMDVADYAADDIHSDHGWDTDLDEDVEPESALILAVVDCAVLW